MTRFVVAPLLKTSRMYTFPLSLETKRRRMVVERAIRQCMVSENGALPQLCVVRDCVCEHLVAHPHVHNAIRNEQLARRAAPHRCRKSDVHALNVKQQADATAVIPKDKAAAACVFFRGPWRRSTRTW